MVKVLALMEPIIQLMEEGSQVIIKQKMRSKEEYVFY